MCGVQYVCACHRVCRHLFVALHFGPLIDYLYSQLEEKQIRQQQIRAMNEQLKVLKSGDEKMDEKEQLVAKYNARLKDLLIPPEQLKVIQEEMVRDRAVCGAPRCILALSTETTQHNNTTSHNTTQYNNTNTAQTQTHPVPGTT